MGTKHGEEGRFRLNRLARPGTMAPRGVINGKSPLESKRLDRYHGPLFAWARANWEMSA